MKNQLIYACMVMVFLLCACKKDFLDKKPNKALLVPTTLEDFEALLDNSNTIMNYVPVYSSFCTDDIYMANSGFASAAVQVQNSYIWAKDLYQGLSQQDWNRTYQQVFYSNAVLDGLKTLNSTAKSLSKFNQIKGTALFSRAFAHYNIAQQFGPVYTSTAEKEQGIPVRLTADINIKSERGTLQQTYKQIKEDLIAASELLPLKSDYKTRPTKIAALAMLARVCLTMEDYGLARSYAVSALNLDPTLLDYNSLNLTANYPLPTALTNANPEVLYYAMLNSNLSLSSSTLTGINADLYHSYTANDLRKQVYFKLNANGVYNFKGSYSGTTDIFAGIAIDEVYLILAECEARANNMHPALDALNTLLEKRYAVNTFSPLSAANAEEALKVILEHRRKELVFRNTRWTDLRRLNLDPRFASVIEHTINGITYQLEPNSKRYVFPIPDDVILNTNISQNER